MLDGLNEDALEDILEMYDIRFAVMDVKGRIIYPSRIIYLNPLFSDDAETLFHEATHHYLEYFLNERMPEDWIEEQSLLYLLDNPHLYEVLEKYIPRGQLPLPYD